MFPLRKSLSAAASNSGMTFTSLFALLSSSLAMSVTGGGLTPYEARAAQAAVAGLFGDEAAAAELERATPYSARPSVHLIPAQPIRAPAIEQVQFSEVVDDLGLLGAPNDIRVLATADQPQLVIQEEHASGGRAEFVLAAASVR